MTVSSGWGQGSPKPKLSASGRFHQGPRQVEQYNSNGSCTIEKILPVLLTAKSLLGNPFDQMTLWRMALMV